MLVTTGIAIGGGAAYVAASASDTPLTILGSDLVLWLDGQDTDTLYTDTGEGTPTANGASVGRWKDKSGNSNHADQATAGAKPTRSDTLFGGSRTGLSLDGGDALATPAIDLTGTAAIEVWVVAQGDPADANEIILEAGGTVGEDGSFSVYYYGGFASAGHWAPLSGADASGDSSAHVYRYTADRSLGAGSEDELYTDGVASGGAYGGNSTGNFANLPINIGARNGASAFFTGSIGEIVIAKRSLTAGEATSLLSYLSAKWGTP